MLPFDSPENIRKPLIPLKTFNLLMFSGGSKGNIGKKRIKANEILMTTQLFIFKKSTAVYSSTHDNHISIINH